MQLIFLGNAACYPNPHRGLSGTVLKLNDGSCWLFNCGEGTQIQLQKSCVKIGKINKIFISHLHSDHLFGLPGLLCTISICCSENAHPPLEIYGPKGLRQYLRVNLALSRSLLDFSYIVHELDVCTEQLPSDWNQWNVLLEAQNVSHPNEEIGHLIKRNSQNNTWHVYEDDHVTVKANWLQHQVPSYGYVIHEKPLPGNLDITKLEAFSLQPGPLCALLKKGESVSNGYGRIISPSEVLGRPRPGRKIALIGDTANSEAMEKIAQNVDVLVYEVINEDHLKGINIKKRHSTSNMAATFAQNIKARQLILTNFSQPHLSKAHEKVEPKDIVEKMICQASCIYRKGEVRFAEDLMAINIPLKKPSRY